MNKRGVLIAIIAIAIVWIGSSAISKFLVQEKNPRVRYLGIILGNDSDKILHRVCFNCHSNETKWPWYSSLPIVSVLISQDVGDARKHLNFSDWNSMSEDQRNFNLKMAFNEIEHDEMPPFIYRLGHPESKLTQSDLVTLKKTADSMGITFNPIEK